MTIKSVVVDYEADLEYAKPIYGDGLGEGEKGKTSTTSSVAAYAKKTRECDNLTMTGSAKSRSTMHEHNAYVERLMKEPHTENKDKLLQTFHFISKIQIWMFISHNCT